MKKIIVTIYFFVVLLNVAFAQFILDEDGKPQPFSLQPPYREMIKPETMTPNYVTKAYNNDSLLVAYNPPGSPEDVLASGFVIDSTRYDFKEVATHFDLGHGDLWIYKLTSPTAKCLTIRFEHFNIPKGALLSYYQLNGSSPFNETPRVFNSDNERFFLTAGCLGNEVIVEYYEPKEMKNPLTITFKYIGYDFTDGLGVRLNDYYKKKVDIEPTNLKSGYWGFSNYNCNNTLPCPGVSSWSTPSKSVAFLFKQITISGIRYTIKGTGFFINKGNNYIADDYPYLITCGHDFNYGTNKALYENVNVYVNYEDKTCNDTNIRQGSFAGSYDILQIGTTIDPNLTGYSASEDYALLKSDKKVSELAKSNVSYAGWSSSFSFSSSKTGYTYIGHPGGNVKTVNTETSFAVQNGSANFRLTNKVGVNETGFSGSPVFYSGDRDVVGWVCVKGTGNYNCGDGNQSTYCGLFRELYFKINSYIDPTNNGSATTSQPTEVSLPAHCKNCIQDGDETDIDCGGSCQPCGMADDLSIATSNDIYRSNLKSRFKISFGDGNSMINLKPGSYELNAGQSIILKSCKISDGATLKASVNQTQIYEPFKGCQTSCFNPISLACNADYVPVVINQAFVKSSYFKVYNSWGGLVDVGTIPTYDFYENGQFFTNDLAAKISNGTFYLTHSYTDCNGNSYLAQSFLTVGCSGCKSAEITTSSEMLNQTNPFSVFPNPACDYINVFVTSQSQANELYTIEIYSINGKLLKNIKVRNNLNTVDIADLLSGTYIIRVKASTNNFYEKFIKE